MDQKEVYRTQISCVTLQACSQLYSEERNFQCAIRKTHIFLQIGITLDYGGQTKKVFLHCEAGEIMYTIVFWTGK